MMASPYEFLLLQILAGCSAILSLKDLSSRAQMFKCVIIVFLTYSITYLCYKVINNAGLSGIRTLMFAYFAASSILTLLIYPLMLVIERTFGFISSVTLIELSNLNSKLLQRMSQEAPGTFQHSMQVGNLAAEAAIAIGANALEVRTGALYHDIGKLENPIYFTENQNGGINPHDTMSAVESAQVIIKHVTDGLATAEHEGLPKKIKEFIATHHGLSKTGYFYITYKNEHPDEEIDEKLFTYPGPRPTTKEQAVLMMADCVEAASHSLKEYTEKDICELVEKIIDAKFKEGELMMSPLTFRDIHVIKTVFKKRLMAIYHTRISYPTEKKQ
jgi:putative nucleotidyltransferase with HDIG domain